MSRKSTASKKTTTSKHSWWNWKKILTLIVSVSTLTAGFIWQESIKAYVTERRPFAERAKIKIYLTSRFEVPSVRGLPVQMLAIANQGSRHSGELEIVIQMQKGDISGFPNFRITSAAKVVDLVQTDTTLSFTTPKLAQNTAIYVTMCQIAPVRPSDVRVSDETRTILSSEIIQLQP